MAANNKALSAYLAQDKPDARIAIELLPILISDGRHKQAQQLVAVLQSQFTKSDDAVSKALFSTALATNDAQQLRVWLHKSLNACRRAAKGRTAAALLEKIISRAWNHLDENDRLYLLEQVELLARARNDEQCQPLDFLRVRMLLRQPSLPQASNRDQVLRTAVANATLTPKTLVEMLSLLDAAGASRDLQVELLAIAIDARKPARRRDFILHTVGLLQQPYLQQTIAERFASAPKMVLVKDKSYRQFTIGNWNRNPAMAGTPLRLSEILMADHPRDAYCMAAVAIARHTSAAKLNDSEQQKTVKLAIEAIDRTLGHAKTLKYDQQQLLQDVTAILTPKQIEDVIRRIDIRLNADGKAVSMLLAKGLILRAAGRLADAADCFRQAAQLAPNDFTVERLFVSVMREQGRDAELADFLSAHLTQSTIMQSSLWRTLCELCIALNRPAEALRAARGNQSPLGPVQVIHAAACSKDIDLTLLTLRRFLIANRNKQRYFSPFWPLPPSPQGMQAFLADPDEDRSARDRLFAGLSGHKFARDEFYSLLRSAQPGRNDVQDLAVGIVRATVTDKQIDSLIQSFEERFKNNSLDKLDMAMVLCLPKEAPQAIARLSDELVERIVKHLDWNDPAELDGIAQILILRGDTKISDAKIGLAILQWAVAGDMWEGRIAYRRKQSLARLETLIAAYPQAEQAAQTRRMFNRLAPTPLGSLIDDLDSLRMSKLAAAISPSKDAAGGSVERVDAILKTVPSELICPGPRLSAAVAKLEAIAGRPKRHEAALDRFFAALASDVRPKESFDFRTLLPQATQMHQSKQYLDTTVGRLEVWAAVAPARKHQQVKALCLLGRWAADNRLDAQASRLLAMATQILSEYPDGPWVWAADLARQIGRTDEAEIIETRLYEQKRLPLTRRTAVK